VDRLSSKSLPPTRSFGSFTADNLVLSAVKKADQDASILVRLYEIEGRAAETPAEFLGQKREFREVNLLEEDTGPAGQRLLKLGPCQIKTIKLQASR